MQTIQEHVAGALRRVSFSASCREPNPTNPTSDTAAMEVDAPQEPAEPAGFFSTKVEHTQVASICCSPHAVCRPGLASEL